MTRPIAISLSPNTEPDDIRKAWHALIHPRLWRDEKIVQKAEHRLEEWFNKQSKSTNDIRMPRINSDNSDVKSRGDHVPFRDDNSYHSDRVVLTSSGRQALYILLHALGIGPGDEVIVQAFSCIAVPAPILWLGAKPIYADIDPATYNLQPTNLLSKITPRTKAIIVQHTFGIPGPLKELQAIARERKIFLIEDCAHALGQTWQGRPLGTFGDAAILSFGRDKILSTIFGGAVLCRDAALIQRVRSELHLLPLPPPRWTLQQLLHPILFHYSILPLYFKRRLGQAILVAFLRAKILSKAVTHAERSGGKPVHVGFRFSPALAFLLMQQLSKLDRYTARRQAISKKYQAALSEGSAQALLRFPLERENAAEVRRQALGHEMFLGDWYDSPLGPADSNLIAFAYTVGSCPVAEKASRRILNLPTYPTLTDGQIEHIISWVKTKA